ncbi:tyrosine-type recombinase/integrase [Lacipirellula parvula]|uniref:Tyr recombinase domain-containing protein n=1 Tax=Lacipirellula parvula TaxID=2650471 RepID=A0A5K7X4U2_9BACT|nr:site-specific integrase [Lacipirellula parvula]BBO31568.1 hypothetical protein PLANPX_1180 [Lacipirellula parvula]
MASLSKDKQGNRTIQFSAGEKKRRSIRLGKMPQKEAENIKGHVEALIAALISQTSWSAKTSEWVRNLTPTLHDKLAKVGLLPPRSAKSASTLGEFLAAYIEGRSDVKESTAINYRATERGLLEYFGAKKLLADVTAEDADKWRRWLAAGEKRANGTVVRKKLGDNTVRRRCGFARQFFRAAVRDRIITENPFAGMKGVSVRSNRERDYFVTREEAAKVLDACPDAQWRLLFALSRFGGLRCPSEHLALRWVDVDWQANRITVRSPKTEHHHGGASRPLPIFPELRPFLEDAWAIVEATVNAMPPKERAKAYVITRYRGANANLRTQLERIIARAGLTPWPKLFQNLRQTRATEIVAEYPQHVASEWLGHTIEIAQAFYWRTTEEDFARAATQPTGGKALQNPVQYSAARDGSESFSVQPQAGKRENSEDLAENQCSLMDSNHEPTD